MAASEASEGIEMVGMMQSPNTQNPVTAQKNCVFRTIAGIYERRSVLRSLPKTQQLAKMASVNDGSVLGKQVDMVLKKTLLDIKEPFLKRSGSPELIFESKEELIGYANRNVKEGDELFLIWYGGSQPRAHATSLFKLPGPDEDIVIKDSAIRNADELFRIWPKVQRRARFMPLDELDKIFL